MSTVGGGSSGGARDAARAGTPARSAVLLLAVAAVVLAVLGAALAGPWQAAPRPVGEVPLPPAASREAVTAAPVEPPLVTAEDGGGGGIHPMVLVVAALVVLGALLARWLLGRATFARGGAVVGHETAAGRQVDVAAETLEPDLPALRRGVDAAQAALAAAGEADDVVIAAWLELEAAAASSGVPRAPAQTPTEFTTAVLDATAADPAATRTLLGLYHRARFGRGEAGRMGAAEVATATECLRRLAASWSAPAPAAAPARVARGEATP